MGLLTQHVTRRLSPSAHPTGRDSKRPGFDPGLGAGPGARAPCRRSSSPARRCGEGPPNGAARRSGVGRGASHVLGSEKEVTEWACCRVADENKTAPQSKSPATNECPKTQHRIVLKNEQKFELKSEEASLNTIIWCRGIVVLPREENDTLPGVTLDQDQDVGRRTRLSPESLLGRWAGVALKLTNTKNRTPTDPQTTWTHGFL